MATDSFYAWTKGSIFRSICSSREGSKIGKGRQRVAVDCPVSPCQRMYPFRDVASSLVMATSSTVESATAKTTESVNAAAMESATANEPVKPAIVESAAVETTTPSAGV